MSDIDRARNSLDAQLAKMGYVHPESTNQGTSGGYQAYNESGDKAYVPQSYDKYATFNADSKAQTQVQKTDICPKCDTKALYSCSCPIGEMMCKHNHMWYVEKNGKLVLGDPHEKEDQ